MDIYKRHIQQIVVEMCAQEPNAAFQTHRGSGSIILFVIKNSTQAEGKNKTRLERKAEQGRQETEQNSVNGA